MILTQPRRHLLQRNQPCRRQHAPLPHATTQRLPNLSAPATSPPPFPPASTPLARPALSTNRTLPYRTRLVNSATPTPSAARSVFKHPRPIQMHRQTQPHGPVANLLHRRHRHHRFHPTLIVRILDTNQSRRCMEEYRPGKTTPRTFSQDSTPLRRHQPSATCTRRRPPSCPSPNPSHAHAPRTQSSCPCFACSRNCDLVAHRPGRHKQRRLTSEDSPPHEPPTGSMSGLPDTHHRQPQPPPSPPASSL